MMSRVIERADDVAPIAPDASRLLPVVPELSGVLPWPGLRRGATVAVLGSASLVLALLAAPMAAGSWAAVVGIPHLGAVAAGEYGLDLSHLALIPSPGEQWATVTAALIDGIDLVVVAPPRNVPAGTAQSLMARARQRGAVLLPTGQPWPGSDLALTVTQRRWQGLGKGRGRLRLQDVTIASDGRGRAQRRRTVTTTLPPASLAARIAAVPGQVPGVPPNRMIDPDRIFRDQQQMATRWRHKNVG
ncbi:hypothetical protein ACIOBK_33870 [Micromonospora chokoriensis]